jgi:hypothetical protein
LLWREGCLAGHPLRDGGTVFAAVKAGALRVACGQS